MDNFFQLGVEKSKNRSKIGRLVWTPERGFHLSEDATTSAPTTSTTTTTESTTIIEMITIMETTFATLETDTPATSTPPTPDNYNRSDSTNQSLSTVHSNGADEGNDGLNGIVSFKAFHFLGGFLLAFTLVASKCLKRRRQSYNVEEITLRYFKQMDKVGGNSNSTSNSERPIESSLFKSISEGENGPDGNGSGNANSPSSTSMPTSPPQLFQQLPLSMMTNLAETSLKKTE
ncbi:hypothetical protein TYRP_022868 [Tyrophagus putrescentiae]|nr:hypothetical protein TYRP_022868 [Tyrophagus putrescentiae]